MWHFDLWFVRTYVVSNKKIYMLYIFLRKVGLKRALDSSEVLNVATCCYRTHNLMEQHYWRYGQKQKKQPWLCYITDNLLDLICSILQGYTIQELIWNGMSTFLYLTIEHTFAMMSDEFKYMYTAQLCMVPGQATKSSDHPITTWARYINA